METGFTRAQQEAGGRFDALVNNAGGGWFGPGALLPPDDLRAQFDALTFGPIRLIQLALPAMRSQPGGRIINVTSLAARLPLPYGAAYSAAKAALSVFTGALQMEETGPTRPGEHRVTFVDLQPGDINTGFNRAMAFWPGKDDAGDPLAASVRRSLAASDASMSGAPPPERVADVIRDLIFRTSPPAPQVTVGNVWQGLGGSLAYRFLPRRLLLWTVRKKLRPLNTPLFHMEHQPAIATKSVWYDRVCSPRECLKRRCRIQPVV